MKMVELHDLTVVLKDPSVEKVRASLANLRKMGVAFPTQMNSYSIHGLATPHILAQLQQARDVLVLSRRLEIVEAHVSRSIDAATALREIEEKEQRAAAAAQFAETESKLGRKMEEDGDIAEEAVTEETKKKPTTTKKKKKTTKKTSKTPTKQKTKPKTKAKAKPKVNKKKAKNKRKTVNKSKRQNRKRR